MGLATFSFPPKIFTKKGQKNVEKEVSLRSDRRGEEIELRKQK